MRKHPVNQITYKFGILQKNDGIVCVNVVSDGMTV